MANIFTRKTSIAVGTALTAVGSAPGTLTQYVVPAATSVTVIGLTVANVTVGAIKASVQHFDGTNTTYIVKDMDIVPGQAQVIVGGDQKLVLQVGDSIRVVSNTAASLDVVMSCLEMT